MVIELDLNTTTTKRGKGTCCVGESNGQDRTDVETDIGINDVLRFDNANFSSVVSESQSELPELLPKSGSLNSYCIIFRLSRSDQSLGKTFVVIFITVRSILKILPVIPTSPFLSLHILMSANGLTLYQIYNHIQGVPKKSCL